MTDSHPRTVLCYGDSNTHGTVPMNHRDDRRRHPPAVRWPGVLASGLGEGWRVVEEGLPGRTTVHDDPVEGGTPDGRDRNGLAFLPTALATHAPLTHGVLMLGTNDLKARFAVTANDIALGVEKCLLCMRNAAVDAAGGPPAILLVAPPPIIETGPGEVLFAGGAAKSRELGRYLAAIAARHEAAFLDAGTVIASSPLDGIHFDAATHADLGRAIAEALPARA